MEAYDCFISYAHEDVGEAFRLYELLSGSNIATFMDVKTVAPGETWADRTREAACRAKVLVLLDSPASRSSAWVQQEAGMALASGSLVLPLSLDGRPDELPGWLSGIQAMTLRRDEGQPSDLAAAVDQVRHFLAAVDGPLPSFLLTPDTVPRFVLKAVLLDQFTAPMERMGAWSRQYDRYLEMYWGAERVRPDVSQGASLTFTGIIVERVVRALPTLDSSEARLVLGALAQAESFILASQDIDEGGFGRRSAHLPPRGPTKLELDLRHTCWAIRALMALDAVRFESVIGHALEWLKWHVQHRARQGCWCWTVAPLLTLLYDERALAFNSWASIRNQALPEVQRDLHADFSLAHGSWVNGETGHKQWVATDNSLYVLHALSGISVLPQSLTEQTKAAMRRLIAKLRPGPNGSYGLPLFTDTPEVGPTAHLLDIIARDTRLADLMAPEEREKLSRFVLQGVAAPMTMPLTFSWHFSGALTSPSLRGCRLTAATPRNLSP